MTGIQIHVHIQEPMKAWQNKFAIPERYEIKWRSFNQTVGRTIRAVRIPNKCMESR
jgi:hypothetical protein